MSYRSMSSEGERPSRTPDLDYPATQTAKREAVREREKESAHKAKISEKMWRNSETKGGEIGEKWRRKWKKGTSPRDEMEGRLKKK